jgi:hypothetical protein
MHRDSDRPHNPMAIYGIDFSGALDAGRKIWISLAMIKDDALEIRDCFQGFSLPNSGKRLQDCLAALVTFIASHRNSLFGIDFPFGIPHNSVEKIGFDSWVEFIAVFPKQFSSPHEFQSKCKEVFGKREAKRTTDRESHTPFSPYNLHLFRQTYFGIKDILYPLLMKGGACVLPMQEIIHDKPLILEICPRSTLIKENIAGKKYKGKTREYRENRRHILTSLQEKNVIISDDILRRSIIADPGGDALDSVLAAYTVWKALRNPTFPFPKGWEKAYALEGYVYT